MKIKVTWSDIFSGKPGRTTECMVALALKRELGLPYASVGHRIATVARHGRCVSVYLPRAVQQRIRFWDHAGFVLPFSFDLCCSGYLYGEAADEVFLVPQPVERKRAPRLLGLGWSANWGQWQFARAA